MGSLLFSAPDPCSPSLPSPQGSSIWTNHQALFALQLLVYFFYGSYRQGPEDV